MSIIDFWILPLLCLKKPVTLVESGGVSVEAGQRDQLAATFRATERRVIGLSAVTNQ